MSRNVIMIKGVPATVLFVLIAVFGAMFARPSEAADERTPVVFIPGVLGSVLARRDDPKDIVFGILPDSIDRFAELQLPWDLSENSLVSVDIVREVKGPKGGDQYNLFIQRMARLGYVEGRDLFLFHYDWRLSNFRTATRLRNFIHANGLAGKPIDIVGHSMGGLVALVYIHSFPEEQKVRNYVAMGTPFLGSVGAVRVLTEGFRYFGLKNGVVVPAGNVSLIYKVFGASEAIYELLPLHQGCCQIRFKGEGDLVLLDFSDPSNWDRYDLWYDKKARFNNSVASERVKESFARLRQLNDLVRRPLPPNVRPVAVIGNKAEKTLLQARVNARGMNKHVWGVAKNAGDGTVAVVSAMGALPRDTTVWIESQALHQHLFDDDAVWQKLGPTLLQE